MILTKDLKKTGVYCILNIVNNKVYVGSSINMYSRLMKHRSLLRNNKHDNIILQNSWIKHGEDKFYCFIVEVCKQSELTDREQHYINTLNSYYNITRIVDRNVLSKESRLKQSETRKRKIKNGEIKLSWKSVHKYSLSGEYINSYKSIKDACIDNNIHYSSICRVLNGTYKQAKGFQWSFSKTDKLEPVEYQHRELKTLQKSVNLVDYDTLEVIETFNSIKECAKFLNIFPSSLSKAIKVKQKINNKYMVVLHQP